MGRLEDALETLDDWLSYQENLHTKEIDLGLERVQKIYQKLFPQGMPFKVITVAGTNGKGSTIAFMITSINRQISKLLSLPRHIFLDTTSAL
ncbi:Dihydrofolate synthase (EC @ Folylpolyglutamate synthase (EC [uncultured Gammaproteobacteria bacterium]|nr:Dihydrofolate synthase (EC @ Folylpolyglutamate synthase (EC [uncultured Gammaproteobacteria bacterium]